MRSNRFHKLVQENCGSNEDEEFERTVKALDTAMK